MYGKRDAAAAGLDDDLLAGVVHGDDRGVVEAGRRLGLSPEPGLEHRVAGEVGAQQLDGDHPTEPGVPAEVDLGHATAPEEVPHLVAVAQDTGALGALVHRFHPLLRRSCYSHHRYIGVIATHRSQSATDLAVGGVNTPSPCPQVLSAAFPVPVNRR